MSDCTAQERWHGVSGTRQPRQVEYAVGVFEDVGIADQIPHRPDEDGLGQYADQARRRVASGSVEGNGDPIRRIIPRADLTALWPSIPRTTFIQRTHDTRETRKRLAVGGSPALFAHVPALGTSGSARA